MKKEGKKDFCAQVAAQLMVKEIEKGSDCKNIVLSPFSYTAVLNMIAAGATGPTLKQMLQYLGAQDIDDLNTKFLDMEGIATGNNKKISSGGGPDLCFLSGIWITQKFRLKESYQELVKHVYKTIARTVDFSKPEEVAKEANSWAKSATNGLIDEVLKPEHIKEQASFLLANALYFKGSWTDPFLKTLTRDKDFYLLNGDKVSVPFMTGCNKYSYGSFESYQVVKIPYERGNCKRHFAMYMFLPDQQDGLPSLLKKVNSDPNFFTQDFRLWYENLDAFNIPKFKFSYTTLEGLETMKEMGLTLPFERTCRDLTEIMEEDIYISMILQKAFVEIDEKGTEAAAVTFAEGYPCGCCLYKAPPKRFVADHPFLFMIREETERSVLFTGAVVNPLLDGSDD